MGAVWTDRLQQRLSVVRAGADDPDAQWAAQPYMLEGALSVDDVLGFRAWADVLSEPYAPVAEAVAAIAARQGEAELWVFVATWCGDCKRDVPHLLQVLASAGWPETRLKLIGVDWDKRDPDGLVDAWRVERVPTMVVVRDGRELGRLVERPQVSIEQDLAALLGG